MAILGKVAGTMLKDNLVRNGVDLVVDGNLLYFDVANRRIGINNTIPNVALDVNGAALVSNISFVEGNITALNTDLILNSLLGNIDATNHIISNVTDPINNQDAATKNYVDMMANVAMSVNLAITDGTANTSIDITTETLSVLGVANQTNVVVTNNTITFGLADIVNLSGNVTVGNLITDGNIIFSNNRPYSGLTVSEINDANVTSNVVTAVHTIRTNRDTGLFVTDFGSGEVVLSLGSSFKTWVFAGQPNLVAFGEDTIEVIAGNGIAFTTNNTPSPYKTWQIDFTGNVDIPLYVGNTDASIDSTTGALVVAGGLGIAGDLNLNGNLTANGVIYAPGSIQGNVSGYFDGIIGANTPNTANFTTIYASSTLFSNADAYVSNLYINDTNIAATNTNANIFITPNGNGYVDINTNSALGLPVGNSLGRPDYATEGMIRYNTALNSCEFFDGAQWVALGGVVTTTIVSDQFTGDGVTYQFTLTDNTTTGAVLVTINGVVQIPFIAYNIVSNNILEFIEPPVSTDVIEARTLTTYASATSISTGNSLVEFDSASSGYSLIVSISGNVVNYVSPNATTIYNSLVANAGIVAGNANVSLTQNVETNVDQFSINLYRTAKYVVSVSDFSNSKYQSNEILINHDGANATITTYASITTGGADFVDYNVNVSGSTVYLTANSSSAASYCKILPSYVPV